jgi:ABC-type branched-subunit amino acid transport system substrate-binding protein
MSRFLNSTKGILALACVSVLLGTITFQRLGAAGGAGGGTGPVTAQGPGEAADVGGPGAAGTDAGAAGGGAAAAIGGAAKAAASGLECRRGKNGGATDIGVTGDRIKLAATVVQSGIGASFLGSSPIGIQAVVRKINSEGGICGRILDIKLVDDAWDANRGLGFIRNFIEEGVFALPVTPSSEGLTAAIESGDISKAGVPVVGSDGMLIQQYRNPWVWPVATATVSTMRIMAKYAYDSGVRKFGLVYDKLYRFGKEGSQAFKEYVEKLPAAEVKSFVGINPGQPNYSSDVEEFNQRCSNDCEFVGLLLEPGTAETWIAGRPQFGTKMTSGAQTLFNERFAQNCGKLCSGMLVWTGYNPAVGPLAALPDIAAFRADVQSVSPTVDVTNQFLQGSYLGMTVFAEALKRVGPQLTRARLRQVLDSMDFQSSMASQLSWRPNQRHANATAHAFEVVVTQGSFNGWRDKQTGWVRDPTL